MPRGPPGAAAARGPPGAGVHAGPAPAGTTPSVGVVPCGPHGRKNRSARARRGSAWGAGTPGLALAAHPLASAASVRPREAQRNPDASSFPAPPRARGTPVAAACGWPARGRGAGTARPPASAARAGPPAHRTGSRGSLGHRGGRCAPPPRTARTRTLAPRHPPPLWRPEGFTPPAARAILYPVIRSVHRATAAGDQEVRDTSPDLHPQHTALLATPSPAEATGPPYRWWVTSDEHTPGVSGERLSRV
jgi:hypothetical protein